MSKENARDWNARHKQRLGRPTAHELNIDWDEDRIYREDPPEVEQAERSRRRETHDERTR